jgi:hypothetical protein
MRCDWMTRCEPKKEFRGTKEQRLLEIGGSERLRGRSVTGSNPLLALSWRGVIALIASGSSADNNYIADIDGLVRRMLAALGG